MPRLDDARILMGMRYLLPLLLFTAACGGSPTGPTPAPVSSSYTVSGTITATNGGQPLAGVTLEASGASATTDAGGRYTLTLSQASARYTLHGDGIVTRTGMLRGGSTDLEAFAGDFDLGYFRQLARGALDNPSLQPLRRWTAAPKVYIRTVDEAGAPMEPATLAMTSAAIASTAAQFTGNTLSVDSIAQGTDTREGSAGWVTVKWQPGNTGHCGTSSVGISGGTMLLQYQTPGCACGGFQIKPHTVKHELGHAFGLWHSGTAGDLMAPSTTACDGTPTAREQAYARYLYRRPAGNTDADNDPN